MNGLILCFDLLSSISDWSVRLIVTSPPYNIGKEHKEKTDLFSVFQELGLVIRNRIVWHFEHGLHCSKRFSGKYETISWFN